MVSPCCGSPATKEDRKGNMKSAATASVPLLVMCFFAGMWTTGVYYNYYTEAVNEGIPEPQMKWRHRQVQNTSQEGLDIWARRNHSYHDVTKVLYNRLPKCGSNTMKVLIRELKTRNRFRFFEDRDYGIKLLPKKLLREFVQMVDQLPRPSIYEKHIYYVNFQRFGKHQPTYINLVRDPLERRISGYYYMRFGRLEGNQKEKRTHEEKSQTFDDCVLNNLWECDEFGPKTFTMTQFFCGQESICMEPSQMAVETAKENIRRQYAVVGVLEEFSSFLKVLEGVMPQFFRGAHDTWREIESKQMEHQKTAIKIPPSEKAREIMRQRLHLDYQVYDFIKERFHMQKKQLGITDL